MTHLIRSVLRWGNSCGRSLTRLEEELQGSRCRCSRWGALCETTCRSSGCRSTQRVRLRREDGRKSAYTARGWPPIGRTDWGHRNVTSQRFKQQGNKHSGASVTKTRAVPSVKQKLEKIKVFCVHCCSDIPVETGGNRSAAVSFCLNASEVKVELKEWKIQRKVELKRDFSWRDRRQKNQKTKLCFYFIKDSIQPVSSDSPISLSRITTELQ